MTSLNCSEQMKLLIKQLEHSFSSVEWQELADPLNKSTEILMIVFRMSAHFPSFEAYDEALHRSANCILENNLLNINNIIQFGASGLPESDFCSIRGKLNELMPELETVENIEMLDSVNSECEQNILCHLRFMIDMMMNNTEQVLKCFKVGFFMCKRATTVFCTEEFIKVSTGLKEIITMLESKLASSDSRHGGNRFLVVLFSAFSKPLKVVMHALWLLVTFPAIECMKFDVIYSLCQSAVSVFMCASDILIGLTRFLLRDFAMLSKVRDELLQKLQFVREYCNQVLEQDPTDAFIFEELEIEDHGISNGMQETGSPKPAANVEDMQGSSVPKPVFKDMNRTGVNILEESKRTTLKSTMYVNDTAHFQNFCDTDSSAAGVPNEMEKSSAIAPTLEQKSSINFSTETSDVKSKAEVESLPATFQSDNLLDACDVEFKVLTFEQRKTMEIVRKNYELLANPLSFSFQITDSLFQVHCKICGQSFCAEYTVKHLQDQCLVQKSHPVTLFLDINDVELVDSIVPKKKQLVQELIEKINYHKNHFSFAIKITEVEFTILCKICGLALPSENVEEHIKDATHKRNIYRQCMKSEGTRAAIPEISVKNWEFLKPACCENGWKGLWCSLCAQAIGTSVNLWIQHFNNLGHRMKLKLSKELFSLNKMKIGSGKVQVRAESQNSAHMLNSRSICKEASPYTKTNPVKRDATNKFFGREKSQFKVAGQKTANSWGTKSICSEVALHAKTSPTKGKIFSKLFSSVKMRVKADGHEKFEGARRICGQVSAWTKSSPAKGKSFSKPLGMGKVHVGAGRHKKTNLCDVEKNQDRIAPRMKPKTSSLPLVGRSLAKGEIFNKLFFPEKNHVAADQQKSNSWGLRSIHDNVKVATHMKYKISASRSSVGAWRRLDCHMQNTAHRTSERVEPNLVRKFFQKSVQN